MPVPPHLPPSVLRRVSAVQQFKMPLARARSDMDRSTSCLSLETLA